MNKVIAVCLISIFVTGCASQGIKPEERDRSGKFDGAWHVSAHIEKQTFILETSWGDRVRLTCHEDNFSLTLYIKDGRMESLRTIKGDGYIKEDGTFYVNEQFDKIDNRHFIFTGQLSGNKSEGRVVITYEHPTKGCKGTVNLTRLNKAPVKSPDTISESDSEKGVSVYDYYGEAEEEVNSKSYDNNLWSRALVEADGNEQQRKAKYIELRASQLYYSEKVGSISNSKLNKQPTLDTEISGTDITGTYVSDIRGGTSWMFGDQKHMITFKQNGTDIIGTDVNQKAVITGTRKGDTIKYEYYGRKSGLVSGVWKINSDGTKLEGTWKDTYNHNGKWNLTKI